MTAPRISRMSGVLFRLTPEPRAMLTTIRNGTDSQLGGLTLLSLVGTGARAKATLGHLQAAGYAEWHQLPTSTGHTVSGVRITDAGRQALKGKPAMSRTVIAVAIVAVILQSALTACNAVERLLRDQVGTRARAMR